ncbi:MAG: SWIB/MDM2 domain-containing protein [Chlamydiota bacterium]
MAKKTAAKAKKVTTKAKKATTVKVKAAAPKAAKVAKVAKPRKPAADSKFMQPLKVSAELAAVVGKGPLPRTEVTKLLWAYIKKHKCQDDENRRNINPDENLAKIFGGKKAINMFEMTKLVNKHLS